MDRHQEHWKGTPKWSKKETKRDLSGIPFYYILAVMMTALLIVTQLTDIFTTHKISHDVVNNIFWMAWFLFGISAVALILWFATSE